ncbi:hypothetical protein BSLG_008928 [Batrachochytrium salamandrivorans]|nr:hypothetical protein BSLG_008928 [Batrachochytrium salamandrivorans]
MTLSKVVVLWEFSPRLIVFGSVSTIDYTYGTMKIMATMQSTLLTKNKIIISAALVKPIPGVLDRIEYNSSRSYTAEIILLGIAFSKKGQDGSPAHRSDANSFFLSFRLKIYSLGSDGKGMTRVATISDLFLQTVRFSNFIPQSALDERT